MNINENKISLLKNKFVHLGILTALIVAIFFFYNEKSPHAGDESNVDLKVAVVDAERIFKESKVFNDIQSQVESKASQLQESATKQQEGLQSKHKALEAQKTALSQQAYEEGMTKLKAEFEHVNREAYKEKLSIDRAYKGALRDMDEKFSQIVTEFANAHGYSLIINKMQTVYSAASMDVTNDIKGLLDSKHSKYPLTFTKVEDISEEEGR